MHWIVLTPFHTHGDAGAAAPVGDDWITEHISREAHSFHVVPATYAHDRSRKSASAREWRDYFAHALRGWRAASRVRGPVGFITAFPQLAVAVGLIKRLRRSNAPVLAWCYNMGQTFEGAKKRIAQAALSSIDVFVVHSRREIATYAEWLELPPERFVFVPLSVDASVSPTQTESEDEPFVLAMGTANRDYRLLVEALRPLKYPATIVAGAHALSGLPASDDLQTRSGLSGAECRNLCERARIIVVPVDNELTASGQVSLLEAMMLGKPVVATRCAGLQDYVRDGATGLLAPPRDAPALSSAIQRLWTDPLLRRTLGSSALAYANEHFTFRAVAGEMGGLLDRLEKTIRAAA